MINNILIEVLSTIAEEERNKIRQRQREGIAIAKKEGKYKICIELWGKNIIQELGDKNKMPSEEEKKILNEWHLRHNLIPN